MIVTCKMRNISGLYESKAMWKVSSYWPRGLGENDGLYFRLVLRISCLPGEETLIARFQKNQPRSLALPSRNSFFLLTFFCWCRWLKHFLVRTILLT